ncbi:hypothetical protein KJ611_01445 [Patescibacteria group bacterium]|nr:hypothetical protein [Patescibacteria group bacterium]MBU1705163.1 hypothetical protein [Patescibacteria group bacterium]
MLKKAIFGLLISFLLVAPGLTKAQALEPVLISEPEAQTVNLYFFRGEGCPHCADEELYLKELVKSYPEVAVKDFEIWYSAENRNLMKEVANLMQANVTGVPFTIIGDRYWIGWQNNYGTEFVKAIENIKSGETADPVGDLLKGKIEEAPTPVDEPEAERVSKTIDLPLIGEINSASFSLPVLTIIIGALDGFNPCAMWTLVFLIGLLVNMENKRRMWVLGGAFIFTSAAFYFGVLAAWLNLLLFIGFIVWVRWAIGAVALGGGAYYIREFFTNKEGACKVTSDPKRMKTMEKLKDITQSKKFWWALIGIILLAVSVNMIELVCSAGLPAVYTQVLALSNLSTWQYYGYILLYVFIFMLDDLIVFFVAMKTLEVTGLTHKYSRASHIIGGVVMVILGLLLWFKPEWLMFG